MVHPGKIILEYCISLCSIVFLLVNHYIHVHCVDHTSQVTH